VRATRARGSDDAREVQLARPIRKRDGFDVPLAWMEVGGLDRRRRGHLVDGGWPRGGGAGPSESPEASPRWRSGGRAGPVRPAGHQRHRRRGGDLRIRGGPDTRVARPEAGVRPGGRGGGREALPGRLPVRRAVHGLVSAGGPRERIGALREARRPAPGAARRLTQTCRDAERGGQDGSRPSW
jgi:hypothetical protein